MKKLLALLILGFAIFIAQGAHAVEVVEQPSTDPSLPVSPLIITAYKTSQSVQFVQIFNNSDVPFNSDGWSLEAVLSDQGIENEQQLTTLSGWIAPKDYMLISDGSIGGADRIFTNPVPTLTQSVIKISLMHPQFAQQDMVPIAHTQTEFMQRNKTASGAFSTAAQPFSKQVLQTTTELYGHGFYVFPDSTLLQIVEILPVSRDCSPAENDITCGDYIKIFNPTSQSIVLDDFRLRSGYQGQSVSISNSFPLSGEISPGEFRTINLRSDQTPLSLTNTGGFVWLENSYGIMRYDNTIVEYPDASSATKKGVSWAYDDISGLWRWGIPSPGAPNQFPVEESGGKGGVTVKELVPCRSDQYRNPDTGRCRLIEPASTTLTPCKEGQERNSETNRCRNIVSTTSTLKPCDVGQERNPETNRCRKIGAADSQLKPCAANQERNPETNRCRKKTVTELAQDIKDIQSPMLADRTGWLVAGAAVSAAGGYGAWEWRIEMRNAWRRFRSLLAKNPPTD